MLTADVLSPNECLIRVYISAPEFRQLCSWIKGVCGEFTWWSRTWVTVGLATFCIYIRLISVCSLLHSGNSNCHYHNRPHGGAVSQQYHHRSLKFLLFMIWPVIVTCIPSVMNLFACMSRKLTINIYSVLLPLKYGWKIGISLSGFPGSFMNNE